MRLRPNIAVSAPNFGKKGVFRLVFDSFCWVEARLEPIIAVSD